MIKIFTYALSLFIAMLVVTSGTAMAQTQKLSDADRKLLIDNLSGTRERLEKAVAGLSAEQLNFKSAPDKWSVLDCAEHLTESENLFFGMVTETISKTPVTTDRKGLPTDEQLQAIVVNRTNKFQAPEPLKPTGRWKTIDELLTEFNKRRNNSIQLVKTTDVDLRSHIASFPPGSGRSQDTVQILLLMSAHVDRHIAQINEVKASPNFPKK